MSAAAAALHRQPVWLLLAIASGACAAFNGVFAKLTTTSLTSTWSTTLSHLLSLSPRSSHLLTYALRGSFFGLNVLFNGIMWALFTAALTRAPSTTRVSIVNVSMNFLVTAVLGALVFGERLPLLWWVGAALLAAGNVVIGRRSEREGGEGKNEEGDGGQGEGEGLPLMGGEEELEDGGGLRQLDGRDVASGESTREALRKGEDVDAPLS